MVDSGVFVVVGWGMRRGVAAPGSSLALLAAASRRQLGVGGAGATLQRLRQRGSLRRLGLVAAAVTVMGRFVVAVGGVAFITKGKTSSNIVMSILNLYKPKDKIYSFTLKEQNK